MTERRTQQMGDYAEYKSLSLLNSGKVRERFRLVTLEGQEELIIVTTNRISAMDYILPDEIPGKGRALNRISDLWLTMPSMQAICSNHLISSDNRKMPQQFQTPELEGCCMLVKRLQMIPVECIVRGYLTGSGLKSYARDRAVCGIELPAGLVEASQLPEPIFTPTTKAEIGEHDEHIDYPQMVNIISKWLEQMAWRRVVEPEKIAQQICDYSLRLYTTGAEYARERGIIIADTKFEFGMDSEGKVYLADEVLTPDSSRFWPAEGYQPGKVQPSFDKQGVRDWLRTNWDGEGKPPHLPEALIEDTSRRYQKVAKLLRAKV